MGLTAEIECTKIELGLSREILYSSGGLEFSPSVLHRQVLEEGTEFSKVRSAEHNPNVSFFLICSTRHSDQTGKELVDKVQIGTWLAQEGESLTPARGEDLRENARGVPKKDVASNGASSLNGTSSEIGEIYCGSGTGRGFGNCRLVGTFDHELTIAGLLLQWRVEIIFSSNA